jgi:polar amino acid transport system substrate-binding protein
MRAHRRPRALLALLASVLASLLAACGSSSSSSTSSTAGTSGGGAGAATTAPAITPPPAIASAGKIVYCSDITYPPEEFYQGTKPVGSDIDIATEIARRMGASAQFDNTGFDGIIPALLGKKCDAIISGMNDTPARAKQVDFVDYLAVGQSFMVRKGNPAGINTIDDIAGKTVSVEVGTTNADFLRAKSKELQSKGLKAVTIKTFPHDTDAANALATNKVDAYFGDSPVVAYYITKAPDKFTFGGSPVNPIRVGIAVRKDETELRDAMAAAVKAMYADGAMAKILGQWKMSNAALKG